MRFADTVFSEAAVMVTVPGRIRRSTPILKVAVVWPAAIVTVAGMLVSRLFVARDTKTPAPVAGLARVMVPTTVVPAVVEVGFNDRLAIVAGPASPVPSVTVAEISSQLFSTA